MNRAVRLRALGNAVVDKAACLALRLLAKRAWEAEIHALETKDAVR